VSASTAEAARGAFERALAAEPGAAVEIERIWALFEASRPPPGDPDPRRDLLAALGRAAGAGVIRLPSPRNRKLWRAERDPPLPVRIWLNRPRTAAPAAPRPVWHPLIAAAVERAGAGARLPAGLDAVDRWLKSSGHGAPELPLQERSHELFGDEKRLEAFLASRFCLAGGLRAEDLRAYRVVEPFVMTAFDAAAAHAIALENLATYDSVARAVAARPPGAPRPAAVIFGSGNQLARTCASIPERLPRVRTLVYFGDLDAEGLAIPLGVRRALAPGVRVVPWTAAYEALLGRRRAPVEPVEASRAESLSAFFEPGELRVRAAELLVEGSRLAQEAVSRPELERLLPGE
jgi:hypothetical protein